MDEYDPIKEYEEERKLHAFCSEHEIIDIEDVLSRIDKMGFSDDDYHTIFTALTRAKMSYDLEDYFQGQSAKYQAAEMVMRSNETACKKRTKVLQIFNLDRVGKKNLDNLARDYRTLVKGSRLFPGIGKATGLECTATQIERIEAGGANHRVKPIILRTKKDVIEHLAKLYRFQSYGACYKALQRKGVAGLPGDWPKGESDKNIVR